MTDSALDTFLATADPALRRMVTSADAAVRAAGPELEAAYKYRMLMYALRSDWRHWVCAVSTTRGAVNVRFLYGVDMADPAKRLRPGSSHLMTLDFTSAEGLDSDLVEAYVREAVAIHDAAIARHG